MADAERLVALLDNRWMKGDERMIVTLGELREMRKVLLAADRAAIRDYFSAVDAGDDSAYLRAVSLAGAS